MYTLADRMKAVELYLKYDRSSAAVRRALGYPSKRALRQWVDQFETIGTLHAGYRARPEKYSDGQKQAAIDFYRQHGRNLQRTVNALGYPSQLTLGQWLDEAVPDRRRRRTGKARRPAPDPTRRQGNSPTRNTGTPPSPAKTFFTGCTMSFS